MLDNGIRRSDLFACPILVFFCCLGTSLWVGDISPHMDAYFMQRAFMKAGHPCLSFKVIKDKQTQQCAGRLNYSFAFLIILLLLHLPEGYGFANFPTLELAAKALSLLNGTLIPDSNPPVLFTLIFSCTVK
jgi:RNA recognition motif-containing protein